MKTLCMVLVGLLFVVFLLIPSKGSMVNKPVSKEDSLTTIVQTKKKSKLDKLAFGLFVSVLHNNRKEMTNSDQSDEFSFE